MERFFEDNNGDHWKFLKRMTHANGYGEVFYTEHDLLIKDFDARGNFIGDRKQKRTITKRTLFRSEFQSKSNVHIFN
jgi:hypothetical protein